MQTIRTLAALVLYCGGAAAFGQPSNADAGRTEFETSCAGCHGVSGRGDGPVARYLTKAPTDLTTLARRNGGVLPAQRITESIDGRVEVGAHGTREMPVWGRVYRSLAMEPGAGERSADATAQGRMLLLVDYLARLQAK